MGMIEYISSEYSRVYFMTIIHLLYELGLKKNIMIIFTAKRLDKCIIL